MTKINLPPVSPIQPFEVDQNESIQWLDAERPRHLIILVPANSNCAAATRRICALAVETNSCVQLLGLYKDAGEELVLRREMVTASALIRDAKVYVEIILEGGTNWVEAIRNHYQAGDIILCIAEQPTGIRRRPLSQVLESNLKAPVYILSDLSPKQQSGAYWLSNLMSWAGSIGIIAGAFLLQIQIVSITTDWTQTALLILSVIAEIGLIGLWNGLFG